MLYPLLRLLHPSLGAKREGGETELEDRCPLIDVADNLLYAGIFDFLF